MAPPGLKGLVVADTAIGSVRGGEGFYHYRQYDAVEVARHHTFEAAAALLIDGALPTGAGEAAFRAELAHRPPPRRRHLAALGTSPRWPAPRWPACGPPSPCWPTTPPPST